MSDHNPDSTPVQLSFDDNEEWRDIPGYEGKYQASTKGRIWSNHSHKVLSLAPSHGYRTVCLTLNGKPRTWRVHKLIALVFLGPPPSSEFQIDHINRNRADNRIRNLRYLHYIENASQGARRGEQSPRSKLSNKQGCEIKRLWESGEYKAMSDLANMFSVSPTTIRNVINGKRYTPIDCEQDIAD
jgi:hypothetical protein